MCGIAGIVDLKGRRDIPPARLRRMTDAIAHRGPDGEGAWFAPGIGLGHRRLAIIDPEGGAQPLVDGRLTVTFNGMIYNFRELRRELEAAGARFQTDCDTEVLLHGWRRWGADLPHRLDGFFAAAIWDAESETLALLRDRWGKKPLYHCATPDGFLLFGSDLPAITAALDQTPQIARDALADYLAFGYVPEPKSIFEGIGKLPPAHIATVRRGDAHLALRRYWSLKVDPVDEGQTLAEAAAELAPLLRKAVEKRLIADVPLGAFLSGGVDSGAILAIASEIKGGPIDACTMAFDQPEFDESDVAARVAQRYGARHHVETVGADSMASLDGLAAAYGEPFADASAAPTLPLCGLAARHVKVALSGDGGDELFAGYRRYPHHLAEERLKRALPGGIGTAVFGPLAKAYPALPNAPRWLRARSTFESLATDQMGGLFRATAIMTEAERDRLLGNSGRIDAYSSADLLRHHAGHAQTDDPLARAQYVDLQTWLPGRMLVKVDRASMFAGVEVRNPLLDIGVAEWAARLPTRLKLDGMSGKRVLKAALEPHLPRDVLDARKRGFVAPIGQWMAGAFAPEMERLSRQSALAETHLVEPAEVDRLFAALRSGKSDTSRPLWALLMLDRFLARACGIGAKRSAA